MSAAMSRHISVTLTSDHADQKYPFLSKKECTTWVFPETTFSQLKSVIQKETGVPVDHLSIRVCKNGYWVYSGGGGRAWNSGETIFPADDKKVLEILRDTTLSTFYKIVACRDANHCHPLLNVATLSSKKPIDIKEVITIAHLKQKIQEQFSYHPEEQKLVFKNAVIASTTEEECGRTLLSLEIGENSTVHVVLKRKQQPLPSE